MLMYEVSRHSQGVDIRQSNLSLQQTATTRMLQFSSRQQPRLSKANFANTDTHFFIEHIHQLIRAEAFDETVMETHIDEESIHYLATLFATTMVAIPTHWTVDWDVATIIEALEEHRHFTGKVSDPESLSFYVGFDTPGRSTP
jgi:hypothetical protein